MKRMSILSVLLSLSILAGFLFLFPAEWVLLLVTLVALVTVQVIVLRRHLHVVGNTGVRRKGAVDLGKVVRESRAPQVSAPVAPESSGPGERKNLPIDPAVFSRFRAHLDAAENGPQAQSVGSDAGAGAEDSDAPGMQDAKGAGDTPGSLGGGAGQGDAGLADDGDVRVVLSPAARKKSAAAKDSSPAQSVAEGSPQDKQEQDLFADLRTQPLTPARAAGKGRKAKPPLANRNRNAGGAAATDGKEAKAAADFPTADGDGGEENMLLNLVEEALEKTDRAGAAAGLEQVMRLYGDAKEPVPWRVRLAQARLAVLEGRHVQAVEDFEELLKWHPRLAESEYVAQIDQLTSPVSGAPGAELRVSMLLKLLAVFRQTSDRTAMDRLYVLIEKAQEQSGDEKKLIQYYKNHLEIKTVLEDVEGQLDLIDQIGNRYYKLGDTEAARKFYEQGLKLREAQEAASGEAGAAPP